MPNNDPLNSKKAQLRYALVLVTIVTSLTILGYGAYQAFANGPAEVEKMAQAQAEHQTLLPVGTKAPNFILPGIDGKEYQLSDYRGKKAVLVELFATWCPHCQSSVEPLKLLYQVHSKSLEILAINAGDKPPQRSTSQEFKTEYGVPYPILENPSDATLKAYHLEAYPTMYLVDKDGKILYSHDGELHQDGIVEIQAILKKQPSI